ncbi:MAG: diacylglycerol kinase family protein [Caldilineaceae bacterium]|nr:diacylglycerol kinase family protein [Caldilineaceae bacterium]
MTPKRKQATSPPSSPPTVAQPPALATLTGRDRSFLAGRWFSFKAALNGVWYTLSTQPNAWIEVTAVVAVTGVGWWLGLAALEWALLILTFSLVLALEAVNTAVEATVDLVAPHYHPLAKLAKDAAAGALVFAVLGSLGVAAVILGPRLWGVFFGS